MLNVAKTKREKKRNSFSACLKALFACNVYSRQLVFDNTSLQTLFSLVKMTLDCLSINHLGNETSLKRTFR